jgi:hypothetical protein
MATMHFQGTCLGGVFYNGIFFAKIRPEKCDFDQCKGFFMRKMVQTRQISKKKIQIARFLH